MIREIQIANYKSIKRLKLRLGRVNLFIGENGGGKSNILEAIALSSAAANDKLDNEFLASRGIRVTEPKFMRSAFDESDMLQEIKIYIEEDSGDFFSCILHNDNEPYSKWIDKASGKTILEKLDQLLISPDTPAKNKANLKVYTDAVRSLLDKRLEALNLPNFLIYSPENSYLHTFEKAGQIEPIGINGEGIFKLLKVLDSDKSSQKINQIREALQFIDWFEDFEIPEEIVVDKRYIRVKDRYLGSSYFDQRSSNEGFLFLLFYLLLFITDETPNFFAIDNIDASLNPKLCRQLIVKLVEMAKKYEKQVILTTHNPAVLDGLNLDDNEQRLFVIYRNQLGHTKARRLFKPEPLAGQKAVNLSEAFLKGYLGGLPTNF